MPSMVAGYVTYGLRNTIPKARSPVVETYQEES
jgi:hypothetical protein